MLSITDTIRVRRRSGLLKAAASARSPLFCAFSLHLPPWRSVRRSWRRNRDRRGQSQAARPRTATFLGGIGGHTLLMGGLVVSALGLIFGLMIFVRLRNMPVHAAMREVSELIYETCKTYLATQGKFLMLLEASSRSSSSSISGSCKASRLSRSLIILLFSVVGISGSFSVAAFGMRVNTFANSRTAFASLHGKPYPCYDIPLQAGMSIGMLLVSVELLIMLFILLFVPGDLAGACFIGFAIGESLGAAALRVAGGIFTKIADIGSDLMKIVFKIKEDDARNPGVIADCTGDNAGDSVGPSADGFETYGVTGVALITFILLAVQEPAGAGAAAGLDLLHARHDGDLLRHRLLRQRRHRQGPVRQCRQDELRSAADHAGVADFDPVHRPHLRRQLDDDSGARRRHLAVVEAGHGHQLRHAGRRADSRIRQGLHFHQFAARA